MSDLEWVWICIEWRCLRKSHNYVLLNQFQTPFLQTFFTFWWIIKIYGLGEENYLHVGHGFPHGAIMMQRNRNMGGFGNCEQNWSKNMIERKACLDWMSFFQRKMHRGLMEACRASLEWMWTFQILVLGHLDQKMNHGSHPLTAICSHILYNTLGVEVSKSFGLTHGTLHSISTPGAKILAASTRNNYADTENTHETATSSQLVCAYGSYVKMNFIA